MRPNLYNELKLAADRLRQMWGNNPDSVVIMEAADYLSTLSVEDGETPEAVTETPVKKTRAKKAK